MHELPKISANGVVVEAENSGPALTLRFAGNADTRAKDDILSLLLDAHGLALKRQLAKIEIDFRELEFMNSACFKAFVYWLAEVQGLEPKQQYHIYFLANESIHWQRRSLRALSCFAADLVRVEH